MLERIHYIKGLGLLHDANGAPFTLQKASLIYADNGRGKSTMASLFRSCSTNNPALVTNRRTIDGNNDQEARLQFSNGQNAIFQNGSWDNQRPELLVFDADFVEKNVYSGGQITADNKKNLLQFALGDTAVAAQQAYDLANESLNTAKADVTRIKRELSGHHGDFTLQQFRAINTVEDAEAQLEAINLRIAEAEGVQNILTRLMPGALNVPELNVGEFFAILQSSLADVDTNAEARVKQHLQQHGHGLLESWISSGQDFLDMQTCPMCDQPLEGVDLIQAYKSYFNQEYKTLITRVGQLDATSSTLFGQAIADGIQTELTTSTERLTNWLDKVPGEVPVLDVQTIRDTLEALLAYVRRLVEQKNQNILDCVSEAADITHVNSLWAQITQAIVNFNQDLQRRIQDITQYKKGLAAVDINQLRQQIANINWSQRRYEPAVVQLFNDLDMANGLVIKLEQGKETAKQQLSQIMTLTLAAYKDVINGHLLRFGASFSISELDANFTGGGGQATSKFVLEMRGQPLALANGENDFKTALSEGDKRTLAFAFFIAYIESLPDLNNKIIVLDDPMCSFDASRRANTRTTLKRIFEDSNQLIILAHDANFLLDMMGDLLKVKNVSPNDISTVQLRHDANEYSNFDELNLEEKCETTYFKDIRILTEYLAAIGQASPNEVAKTIRPVMEAYLHIKYPNQIPSGLLFGNAIGYINQAQSPSPLVGIQPLINELNEINTYAGRFHHNTAPGHIIENVTDETELRSFVRRALAVIHGV